MKHKNKSVALVVSLILAVCVTVGGTLAFLVDVEGPLNNTFQPSQVTTEVEETNENGVKKNVRITNTGDTEAYIRAAVVITWQNTQGNVYGQMPVAGTDYEINWGSNKWDTKTTDGFYYYTVPVADGASTENLIDSVEPKDTAPEGYFLNVEVIGSGIQSKPTSVVEAEWGVSVSGTTISK